ncbi:hypothetical protein DCS_02991 [Drechmeria coniospora]|uniref:Uncharacterized protein n=1 Tax=Drechmeria coniospora TaxID=98403 RepID=A0A151GXM2_DRECN|nr:hypothetical protein DCS_02991 [Drechmeria coniospora]KYK61847.1 hypothetical protein DCS_02991 [Drechmeria coniospora]
MKFSHAAAILFAAVASAGVAGDRQPKLEPAEPAYDESSALDQSPYEPPTFLQPSQRRFLHANWASR